MSFGARILWLQPAVAAALVMMSGVWRELAVVAVGNPPVDRQPRPQSAQRSRSARTAPSARRRSRSPSARASRSINNDSRSHDMSSDPHPAHTDCPSMNAVGNIWPGQTKLTNAFTTARTCGFHDHDNPDNAALIGRIVIQ